MRYLFLDLDGVLITESSVDASGEQEDSPVEHRLRCRLDPVLVRRLNRVFSECPDVKVVMSSNWRRQLNLKQFQAALKDAGFAGEVVDCTPCKMSLDWRGDEISMFLRNKNLRWDAIDECVILDDVDEFERESQSHRLVLTPGWDVGLTEENTDRIIRLFKESK